MQRSSQLQKLAYVLFCLLAPVSLSAQSEWGNITGVVTDPSGAVSPGATITIVATATNATKTTISGAGGEYNVPLAPGAYQVQVSLPGFKKYLAGNVVVTAATTVRLDIRLELGEFSDVVTVTPDLARLQTENAKISTAVQNRLVDELPLVVGGALRSPFDLVGITAEAKGRNNQLSLGGGQAAAWDATLDGISVTTNRSADAAEIAYTTPSVEAITEFTVDTNGFKAEYGQAGGGVMTFVSKSGTNRIHGSAYDFLRNDALDARGFFPLTKSVYKQNDFGASLGGPVWIPKLYNGKNRTFFFFAFEGFRNRVGGNDQTFSVPTPEMYNGDFSKWVDANGRLIPIYDPATTRPNPNGSGFIRDPFPNNIIPENRFSAFSRQVMKFGQAVQPNLGALPGTSGYVRNNYRVTSGTILNPQTKWSLKLDHNLSTNHHLGFFMNITDFSQKVGQSGPPGLPQPLWNGQVQIFTTSAYRMSYDWTISNRMLNHLSVGGNKFYKFSRSPNVGEDFGLCFKNSVDCKANFPGVEFTEFSGWGGTADNGTEQPLWSIKDDFSLNRGTHNFKMGFAFQSQRAIGFGQQDIAGRARFSYLTTSVPGATSATSGSSFASFLLGEAIFGRTETIRSVPQLYRYYGFYFQDDWRLSRRLTLNLGLRYEFTLPPVSMNDDQYSDFTPDRPNPKVGNYPGALRFAGFGSGRENVRSLVPGWYGGVGPRLGIAFAATDKTTLRAAFGRSFSKVTVVSGSGHFAGFIGQYVFESTNQGITKLYNWDEGLPPYPLPPLIDPSFSNNNNIDHWQPSDAARAPESYYWTFSVQRQLTSSTVLEVAYNATVGAHLQTGNVNMNQVPTAIWDDYVRRLGITGALNLFRAQATSQLARDNGIALPYPHFSDPAIQQQRTVAQALRPFPQYLNIVTGAQGGDKSGHSSYHALVIKAERRFSKGLLFQWNYTFSKILTDSDTYFTGAGAQDQYNRRAEKSIGQFDQTHALKLNTLYELPFGGGRRWLRSGFASHILGGWRVGLIQSYVSGVPIAVTRNNPLPIFNAQTRPTITGYDNWRAPIAGDKFDPARDRFLDRSVFPTQPDAFGNATRFNPKVRAFPGLTENISIAKSFSLGEDRRLDFRWEVFNPFNRTVFGTGSTNLNGNTFGIVTNQVNDPRQMQVGLKIYW
ncbi:MAG: carboxypeptidase regulatory-like domain-containing protein [Acidobacteria bacterium]|nr:carboxypeptidase regulatory-like domain-containing protein [Acidobacteriota bacterium]